MAKKSNMFRDGGEHAPVNPVTGLPNDSTGANVAMGAGAPANASDSQPSMAGDSAQTSTPDLPLSENGIGFSTADATDAAGSFASDPSLGELLDRARTVLDNRVVSTAVLACLLITVVGIDNVLVLVVAFFVGSLLLNRFVSVRRAITMGGLPWFSVVLLGNLICDQVGPLWFSAEYLFMFCGFLLAITVCGVFFAGRAFYYHGLSRGQEIADAAIARHMVDRLIDHPDEVSNLDGTYLEVEGALNRVRDREREQADALRDEARRKDDLVTYLAHDLKTPLASVVGYLSLLEEAPDLPAEQRARFTGIALDKAHRLDALIEEFFDITRFDFHDIVLTRGYVDLALMLAQVADEFYPILSEQGKHAQIEVPEHLTVLIDGDKMARVFNNVMKNAIAYSYEGSTIRVSAGRSERGGTVIRFENQGDPIPAPKLNVIFEKFYRLDAARATNRGGAGLGLAIAKEIVTAHGGTIACESTPEHTVFTITLPEA